MILTLFVKPNARENAILEWVDKDTLKVSVKATPEKGKANKELIQFLSNEWNIPKSAIVITRGITAKIKQLTISNEYQKQLKQKHPS
ncbi:MAG: hypothetical protein UU08_C0035G0001 [Candidatus Uhrbacteria bacterium GW2011_GWE2_40_58]|nr:MAG: hypothetical protein UT94_C0017G0004 [Candidatus Uhrbacteria bacterium GW2011_GWF2_40_263]KKR66689.1 MAG: hypothetical protein UU08_C0035G0001 [Candidatus Uhrbacteria bacterium GW2011_GWE2_40_58]OGL92182.1 MAG: hypothetical protein A2239_02920 [Candidatus Uhrbacteria bacterium RIFOXYA2_FULL_40_9]OGL96689.1 MAG: hypothetical protein A2332_03375 [Candidatus Uhrbacteria bacterium RIFOXYB2_FULL_41_18]HCB56357.1 hypothetical protein [Candidatus Uhrbacteria bacterium]